MNKISLIIRREFNIRVRKRSFILTTLLTPLLIVALMVAPYLLMGVKSSKQLEVMVVDSTGVLASQLHSDETLTFTPCETTYEELLRENPTTYGFLVITPEAMAHPDQIKLYTRQAVTYHVLNQVTGQLRRAIENQKLEAYQIENLTQILQEAKTPVSIQTLRIDAQAGEKTSSRKVALWGSYLFSILIYMFVLLYGVAVMQGVIEEKSSKVLEVLVSSVKPFELMMGKILGIAAVAITQFILWIGLTTLLVSIASYVMGPGGLTQAIAGLNIKELSAVINATDTGFLVQLLGSFLLFFIGGYLLYASLFAAIGSAVDNTQDAQQLQTPVIMILVLGFIISTGTGMDPNGPISFWCSMIPLTSPIVMMARIPHGVPLWEIITSMVILFASFVGTAYVAGKIYRVGIFMSGKKPSFMELYKWMKYKA